MSRPYRKESTLTVLKQTRRCLVGYFGADKRLADVTSADADQWRVWLATEGNVRDNDRDTLSENTIRRHSGRARQFFAAAVKRKLIASNPFSELPTAVRGNQARQRFVTRGEIQAVIDVAPDTEWRLIIALARYGGLRIPSELLALRWADVDLPGGRMTIRASKTEHHVAGGIRTCPIFPELKPYLEAAWDAAAEGADFVIARYRQKNANLRTQLERIIERAGLTPWPKLFHNLRASRQTELLDCFPVKAVCSWLGNSQPVALEHYAQVTDDHFRAAITQATPGRGEAESEAVAKQNPKQHAAAVSRMISRSSTQAVGEHGVVQLGAMTREALQNQTVTPRGLEPLLPP
jgi:integrase